MVKVLLREAAALLRWKGWWPTREGKMWTRKKWKRPQEKRWRKEHQIWMSLYHQVNLNLRTIWEKDLPQAGWLNLLHKVHRERRIFPLFQRDFKVHQSLQLASSGLPRDRPLLPHGSTPRVTNQPLLSRSLQAPCNRSLIRHLKISLHSSSTPRKQALKNRKLLNLIIRRMHPRSLSFNAKSCHSGPSSSRRRQLRKRTSV
jgi:hypothetical protein